MTRSASRMLALVLVGLGALPLALLWRTMRPRPSPPSAAGDRATPTPSLEAPAAGSRPGARTPSTPLPATPQGAPGPTAAAEDPGAEPSGVPPRTPEEHAIENQLGLAMEGHAGLQIMFVTCAEAPCRARVEARDRGSLDAFLREASRRYLGHLGIQIEEHTDAFTGRSYRADLLVGTNEPRDVPSALTL